MGTQGVRLNSGFPRARERRNSTHRMKEIVKEVAVTDYWLFW